MSASVHDQVVAEERAARARQRGLERARRAAARKAASEWHRRLAGVLAKTDTRACRCGLTARMSREDLRALGGGCTSPAHVCGALETVRRRMAL